ncbi:hypothetical protein M758_9G131000 [Ceratodon purpureus]|uniref:Secreted protein n=1 Tax=Ceratodon purpureus TaxID=3225 RepID=A0A8T0GWX0_CERPU|nr:hypothetical protein KC19_9G062700 [Ceratodon purpureus]KAG0606309.1 hypothetical protein M758_9G131000 [Ceratodon purpureus]
MPELALSLGFLVCILPKCLCRLLELRPGLALSEAQAASSTFDRIMIDDRYLASNHPLVSSYFFSFSFSVKLRS